MGTLWAPFWLPNQYTKTDPKATLNINPLFSFEVQPAPISPLELPLQSPIRTHSPLELPPFGIYSFLGRESDEPTAYQNESEMVPTEHQHHIQKAAREGHK